MRGPTLALLLLALGLSGCLGGSADPGSMVVVASAPRLANGMTIAVGVPRGLFEDGEGVANYAISHGGEVLYPPGGVGGFISLSQGRGSAFVPYSNFVVGNGEYEVTVTYKERSAMVRAAVDKWVNFVYVFPYLRNDTVVVDVVLERVSGQPNDRMFAAGQLSVQMRYRGENGTAEPEMRWTKSFRHEGQETFIRFAIPLEDITRSSRNRGFYSVEATFHNEQANGNNNVPLDPALEDPDPPTNWIYLELEDRCTGLIQQPLPEPLPPCPA
jgi:hypothetical protein